jgi:hypothetical protein
MIFLNKSVVSLSYNLSCRVINYHSANWTAAFIIALLCKKHGDTHKISICQPSYKVIVHLVIRNG